MVENMMQRRDFGAIAGLNPGVFILRDETCGSEEDHYFMDAEHSNVSERFAVIEPIFGFLSITSHDGTEKPESYRALRPSTICLFVRYLCGSTSGCSK